MDRVEIIAAARHQLASGGPAGERQLIWQAPPDSGSALGLRGIVALADAGGEPGAGQTAAFVLDHLLRLLTDPDAPAADDRERMADFLYQCVLAVNGELRAAGQVCALTCLCFRDDGFALAHVGGSAAHHLRVAHIHPLTTESTALLGQSETPEVSVGTGTIRAGDRIVLAGRRLGEVVGAADLVSLVGQTDLEVACERLLRLAGDRGQSEPTSITIAQVGPLPVISSSARTAPPALGESNMSYQHPPDYASLGNRSRLEQLTPRQWIQFAVTAIVLALLLGVYSGRKYQASRAQNPAGVVAEQPYAPVTPAANQPAPGTVVGVPADPGVPVGQPGAPAAPGAPTMAAGSTATAAIPAAPAAPAAPVAAPVARAGLPAGKVKLVLLAEGKTFTLTPAAGAQVKVTGLGRYEPKPTADGGYEFTLRSDAKGQDYRFERVGGATATAAAPAVASKGELDDKLPRGSGLAPGRYKLLLGRGIEVADVEVSAPSDVTTPAGPAAAAPAAPAAPTTAVEAPR